MKLTHLIIDEASGNVDVRWMKPARGDKGPEPHRCSFEAGGDADRMFSIVKQDREAHGFTVNDVDLERIKAVCAIAATPEHLEAAAERRAVAQAEAEEQEKQRLANEKAAAEAEAQRKSAEEARIQSLVDAALKARAA